jgi:hypothetical protein
MKKHVRTSNHADNSHVWMDSHNTPIKQEPNRDNAEQHKQDYRNRAKKVYMQVDVIAHEDGPLKERQGVGRIIYLVVEKRQRH